MPEFYLQKDPFSSDFGGESRFAAISKVFQKFRKKMLPYASIREGKIRL